MKDTKLALAMAARQPRGERIALFIVVGLIPAALVGIGVAQYVLNQFYARAPILLDSGWLSAIVYRSGVTQRNPTIACDYAVTYWGVHIAPLLTVFSLLSYLVPVARIEWYAFFQAVVHGSLALPVYFLVACLDPRPRRRWWPILAFAGLAFAMSGQALMSIGYPHYEYLIPAFICLFLVAVVTGRTHATWVFLALALAVREDGGIHAGLALAPLAYLKWRGSPALAVSLRRLLGLMAIAFAVSAVAMAAQKVLLHSADLLRAEYLGTPIFNHLSGAALAERLRFLVTGCVFISVPLIGTALVAGIRRDARYLLGWAAASPWLVVNVLAHQEAKWHFFAYTGFPFLVSVFWVFLYGATLAPAPRRLRGGRSALVLLAICIASVVAVGLTYPDYAVELRSGMLTAEPGNREAVRTFARAIRDRHDAFGRLYVDDAVAALALESLALDETYRAGVLGGDTFAFHRSRVDPHVLADIAAAGITRCTHVIDTGLYLCARSPAAALTLGGVATEPMPTLLALARFESTSRTIELRPEGFVIRKGSAPGIVIASFDGLLEGSFDLVFDLDVADADAPVVDVVTVDVHAYVASSGYVLRATAGSPRTEGSRRLVLPFTARPDQPTVWRLAYAGGATVTITGAQLQRARRSLDP